MSKGRCGISHRHVAEVLDVGSSLAGDMGFTDGNGVSEIAVCLQVDDLTMIQGSVFTLTVMIMLEQDPAICCSMSDPKLPNFGTYVRRFF